MSAPWELCVACARLAAGIATSRDVALAAERIDDWDGAVALLNEQGLLAWLAQSLRDAPRAAAHDRVRAAASEEARRTLGLVHQLTSVCRALSDAGVPALPYKGPALSLQLYGDIGLRQSVDIDIVVPRDAYPRARETLVGMGLAPRGGHSMRQERALFTWLGHASFGTSTTGFVELHWRFAPAQFPFALTPERAIARSSLTQVAGQDLRLMAPDDLLVTLAMHGTRHFYERLEWLAGVARLIRQFPDAVPIAEHARTLRAHRTLLVSAEVAHQLLELPLGPSWQRELDADPAARELAAELTDMVRAHGSRGVDFPVGAPTQTFYARLMDSRVDRVRSLARAVFMPTEREWELVKLPDPLTPLYRVVRLLRLSALYARRLFAGGRLRATIALFSIAPGAALLAFVLILALAATEGVGILFLVPLLQRAGVAGGVPPTASAWSDAIQHLPTDLLPLLAIYVGVVGLRALLEVAEAHASARVEAISTLNLRERLYRALVRARWEVVARLRGARIAHVLAQELQEVSVATNHALRAVLTFFIAGTYGVAALMLSPVLGLVAGVSALLLLAIAWRQQRRARRDGEEFVQLGEELFTGATEHIATLKSAKGAGIAERVADRFTAVARKYSEGWVRASRRAQLSQATLSVGASVSLSVIVYLAVSRLQLSATSLLVLLFVYMRLFFRLASLQNTLIIVNRYLPAMRNVEMLLTELEAAREPVRTGPAVSVPFTRSLRFVAVSYRYPGETRDAIADATFEIPKGVVTALVGASGAGKSTAADLALHLLAPSSGAVQIDDQPLSAELGDSWRTSISYLPQETQLFHDTVRENVRWLVPDAGDDAVREALHLAGASALLDRLPLGLDTVIGDRGHLVSGGERQRIALARALLRHPRLLVLDEATASLDAESESAIRATLATLTPAITVLMITHRLHTARLADHVVLLDEGRVLAEGTWEQVLQHPSSRLAELWQAALGREDFDERPTLEHYPTH